VVLKKQILFRQLITALQEVESNLKTFKKDGADRNLELKKLDALTKIQDYIMGFTWIQQSGLKRKIEVFLKNGLNYNLTVETLELPSKNALEVSITYANKQLEKLIGSNTIELIRKGDVGAAMLQFHTGVGNVLLTEDFLVQDIVAMLPEAEYVGDISATDCSAELKFLNLITYRVLKSQVNKLDHRKLAFLRHILESSDSNFSFERTIIARYLQGEDLGEAGSGLSRLNATLEALRYERPF
jgi:hypothetical protein